MSCCILCGRSVSAQTDGRSVSGSTSASGRKTSKGFFSPDKITYDQYMSKFNEYDNEFKWNLKYDMLDKNFRVNDKPKSKDKSKDNDPEYFQMYNQLFAVRKILAGIFLEKVNHKGHIDLSNINEMEASIIRKLKFRIVERNLIDLNTNQHELYTILFRSNQSDHFTDYLWGMIKNTVQDIEKMFQELPNYIHRDSINNALYYNDTRFKKYYKKAIRIDLNDSENFLNAKDFLSGRQPFQNIIAQTCINKHFTTILIKLSKILQH